MSSLSRALRPHRRELDQQRRAKPNVILEFESRVDRDKHLNDLEVYWETLSTIKESFKDVQRQYLAHTWTKDADQTAADKQAEEDSELITAVDKALSEIKAAVKVLSMKRSDQRAAAQAEIDRDALQVARQNALPSSTVQLPRMELAKFSGNMLEWQPFWDLFNASVHSKASISKVEKLIYLKSQLLGEAAAAISGLSTTEANYDSCINILKQRFGKEELIIHAHYSALTDLHPAQSQKTLRPVVDKMEQHLNSLEALGEDTNHRQFATIIKSKLPPAVEILLEKERDDDDEEWDVDKLRERLQVHLRINEFAYGFSKKIESKSSNSALLVAKSPILPTKDCPFWSFWTVQSGHFADDCPSVTSSSARKEILQGKHICTICLGKSHSDDQCRRIKPCFNCKVVKHNHSCICPQKYPDPPRSSAFIAMHPAIHEVSFLQTARARFISSNGQYSAHVRGVLDNGSHRSFITEELARDLGLKPISTTKLSISKFGTAPPEDINTKVVEVQMLQQDGSVLKFIANVIPSITGLVHRFSVDMEVCGRALSKHPLADVIPSKPENISVQFLIGADYMWDLLHVEKEDLGNGLFLINSKLGWLIAGRQLDKPSISARTNMLFANSLIMSESSAPEIDMKCQPSAGLEETCPSIPTSEEEFFDARDFTSGKKNRRHHRQIKRQVKHDMAMRQQDAPTSSIWISIIWVLIVMTIILSLGGAPQGSGTSQMEPGSSTHQSNKGSSAIPLHPHPQNVSFDWPWPAKHWFIWPPPSSSSLQRPFHQTTTTFSRWECRDNREIDLQGGINSDDKCCVPSLTFESGALSHV